MNVAEGHRETHLITEDPTSTGKFNDLFPCVNDNHKQSKPSVYSDFKSEWVEKLRHIKKLAKIHSSLIKDADDETIREPKISSYRRMLRIECENLMEFEQFRREALSILWQHCFYGPIKIFKTLGELEPDEKEWLQSFISQCISHISCLLQKYPESRHSLLIFLGDLYRYAWTYCGKNGRDLSIAEEAYKKAILADSSDGNPFNQLALPFLKNDSWMALHYFLRSLALPKSFKQAQENLCALKEEYLSSEQQTVLRLCTASLRDQNRVTLDQSRKSFDKFIGCLINEGKELDAITLLYPVLLLNVVILFAEGIDEVSRIVSSMVVQNLNRLLEELKSQNDKLESDGTDKKRRKDSSSSDDDEANKDLSVDNYSMDSSAVEDELKSKIILILACNAEFLSFVGEKFTAKKVPVSLKLDFQNHLRLFVDLLNIILDRLSTLMSSDQAIIDSNLLLEWYLNVSKSDQLSKSSNLLQILAYFVKMALQKIPICFDRYFKVSKDNSIDRDLQRVDAVSRSLSQYSNQLREQEGRIPVYLMPNKDVMLDCLHLLEKLIASKRFTVVMPRKVLSDLDKLKKESQQAREAVRWLESSLQAGRICMSNITDKRQLIDEAIEFLREKSVLDRKTLFLTILATADCGIDIDDDHTKHKSVSIEKIDAFLRRTTKN